eukprot:5021600-Pyramimonas_sp.AAC.1
MIAVLVTRVVHRRRLFAGKGQDPTPIGADTNLLHLVTGHLFVAGRLPLRAERGIGGGVDGALGWSL